MGYLYDTRSEAGQSSPATIIRKSPATAELTARGLARYSTTLTLPSASASSSAWKS